MPQPTAFRQGQAAKSMGTGRTRLTACKCWCPLCACEGREGERKSATQRRLATHWQKVVRALGARHTICDRPAERDIRGCQNVSPFLRLPFRSKVAVARMDTDKVGIGARA